MKRIFFLTVLLSLLIANVLGQSHNEVETDTIVTLVKEIEETKIVILFENKDFIIKMSLSDFKSDIENWLIKHPHIKGDKKLLDIVLKKAESNNTVNTSKIITDVYLEERLKYRIASLLENGKCLILNKKSNEIISEIKIQTYSYRCGALCGEGGRRFYVNEVLFFKVRDWVS